MTVVLTERGNLEVDTHMGRTSCEDGGRDWVTLLQAKAYQRFPENHQKLGEKHGTDYFLQPSEGSKPTNNLTLDS